jgi:hypothetical protein
VWSSIGRDSLEIIEMDPVSYKLRHIIENYIQRNIASVSVETIGDTSHILVGDAEKPIVHQLAW